MSKWKEVIRDWRMKCLLQVAAATWALALIGEQYPFSHFPMYSHLDDHSDVLFLTDLEDQVLPMEALFATSSSTQKKVFITELKALCNPQHRDTRDALPEEREAAGAKVMQRLMKRRDVHATPKDATGLRLYYKEFMLVDGVIRAGDPQRVAEVAL